jgi:hypothetical protein
MNRESILESDKETLKHINRVRDFLDLFIFDLIERAKHHDKSKLESPEREIFGENFQRLSEVEYGSPEYNECKERVMPAILHHYANNRHHPEWHTDGIEGMTLVDLIELLSDWRAAGERNKNGNIRKSLEINAEKYKFSPQLISIFKNTIREYFD